MISIIEKTNMSNVVVDGVKNVYKNEVVIYELRCYVTSVKQLDKLIFNLDKEPYITKVERLIK